MYRYLMLCLTLCDSLSSCIRSCGGAGWCGVRSLWSGPQSGCVCIWTRVLLGGGRGWTARHISGSSVQQLQTQARSQSEEYMNMDAYHFLNLLLSHQHADGCPCHCKYQWFKLLVGNPTPWHCLKVRQWTHWWRLCVFIWNGASSNLTACNF